MSEFYAAWEKRKLTIKRGEALIDKAHELLKKHPTPWNIGCVIATNGKYSTEDSLASAETALNYAISKRMESSGFELVAQSDVEFLRVVYNELKDTIILKQPGCWLIDGHKYPE